MRGAVGLCLGATTITMAQRRGHGVRIDSFPHEGKVAARLLPLLRAVGDAPVGLTGRKFCRQLPLPTVSEPEAVELAFAHLRHRFPDADCIVSVGGETFMLYLLNDEGKIRDVHAGNKCAAGTGEFFTQQARRMGLTLEEALELASWETPHRVAGRCSVFCKSDCTHAMNKGVPKGQVVAGICAMMAGKVAELLKKARARRALIVGGCSLNHVMIDLLRQGYPELAVPEEAVGFEALGAMLWAEQHGLPAGTVEAALACRKRTFAPLPPLGDGLARVTFHTLAPGTFAPGEYLCGLDAGSTTTKAVLMRRDNKSIVASAYLRTNGDPIAASRACYQSLLAQLPSGSTPDIVGLGVTGSGRLIVGLHGMTDGVVNEIVAHATAAVAFDPEVETIFEIGGQDAKYTFISQRVASDYAMNEACSAGTGSFLEEACRETLGVGTEEIAPLALRATHPPNFSDQCAAFIGSDVNSAVQEGVSTEDVAGGLVYSICQNYLNRVKGNRPVGGKIFMQGGVCYNRAVPAAMASLCGQPIVVPPEPGLMGAYGAALEVLSRLENKLLERAPFDLEVLAGREVRYLEPFTCPGREGCDRKCSISRIVLDGCTFPFGGACSRYEGRRAAAKQGEDLVALREEMVFKKHVPTSCATGATVGVLPALFSGTFYPLYAHFFAALGMRVVTPERPAPEGIEAATAPFCHPVLLSHGYLRSALDAGIDHVFLPHVKNAALEGKPGEANCTCPLVQGEPYYLAAAFPEEVPQRLLTAVLDFQDRQKLQGAFTAIGKRLGFSTARSNHAFSVAWESFLTLHREMEERGRRFLDELDPAATAIVLFGRPYQAFSRLANLSIPLKLSDRGCTVIPHDLLFHGESAARDELMYWSTGRQMLQVADLVKRHPNLFGVFVTSFGCGPDSFLLGYFRDRMGRKPSLTLELDAHTADAGIDTRIEAFLDVIRNYRESLASPRVVTRAAVKEGARQDMPRPGKGNASGCRLDAPAVKVLVPTMGVSGSRGVVCAFRYAGVDAVLAPPPGLEELNLGKAVATCKECLPLLLTVGTLRRYLQQEKRPGESLLFFMPGSDGPCRFGQYRVFLENYLVKNDIRDVAVLSLSCENGYAGLPYRFTRRAWQAVCVGDGMDEIEATLRAQAMDVPAALARLELMKERIFASIARDDSNRLLRVIGGEAAALSAFPRKKETKPLIIRLLGEIYVRHDGFSRQGLVERLTERGIVVRTAPVAEWLQYSDYCMSHGLASKSFQARERIKSVLTQKVKAGDRSAVEKELSRSGYYEGEGYDVADLVRASAPLLNPELATEATLTVGTTLLELGRGTHGVISIGPFGCMPSRVAEAVLSGRGRAAGAPLSDLPFLVIEVDGNAFPQLVEARLESFLLAAQRLRDRQVNAPYRFQQGPDKKMPGARCLLQRKLRQPGRLLE
ncbi:acyl-CoA dehydratase activase [Geomonas ferrireducens]|uniref:acyl-CoA dehydratase activase n=1 Tax=Geomonas ferrireducens TaxID=2570227 RepID=UPI0013A5E2A8|nr:acyl-CoA dehydratase activase [Geomonas ferrireducens]